MVAINALLQCAGAGVSVGGSIARAGSGQISQDVSLAAGIAGVLSTRTDNDTGVVTVAAHTITTQDKVNVFWTLAGVLYCRYGLTVTDTDGTTITVDSGAGDNLPTQGTAVVIAKQQTIDLDFDGDLLQLLAMSCDQDSHVTFQTGVGGDIVAGGVLLPANEPWVVWDRRGVSDPFDGEVTASVLVSNGSVTAATWRFLLVYDSDA